MALPKLTQNILGDGVSARVWDRKGTGVLAWNQWGSQAWTAVGVDGKSEMVIIITVSGRNAHHGSRIPNSSRRLRPPVERRGERRCVRLTAVR